jgi:predicted esterase
VQVPARDLLADNDINKRFYLIGPKSDQAPVNGYKLLLVLPGGDGSANFQTFVKNIAAHALGDDYIVAQLVAPKWNEKQSKEKVWPIEKLTVPEASFTTELFMRKVIDEVRKDHTIDANHIYAMGWSSSGQAIYSSMLQEDSPIRGGFVAMSVFHPEVLPPLRNAKGKAFYILHSPTDFINMKFPEAARDRLAEYGGATKLETYEGGHRWVGDVFGMIRTGVKWLEEKSSNRPEVEKSKGSNEQSPKE